MVCLECFFQVSGMLNYLTFYAKVVNNYTECNGVVPDPDDNIISVSTN